jgi:hypothetical protein
LTRPDPEAAYYQGVEEFFVARRGDPLFLSNSDWLLIRGWRRQGIPLRIVLRGIRDALDAHAHSWGRKQKVGSLRYCAAEVDAARDRWQRALATDQPEGLEAAQRVQRLAEALDEARGLGRRAAAVAARLSAGLRREALGAGGVRELEPRLQAAEAELLKAIRRDHGPEAWAELEREVDAALSPYAQRMPARVLADLRSQSLARRSLERHGLPRLSLFDL